MPGRPSSDEKNSTSALANLLPSGVSSCKPTIARTEAVYGPNFRAENVLSGEKHCERGNKISPMFAGQYFLLPNGVVDRGFVVDLGCARSISAVLLRNTHNGDWNDRGTRGFTVELSADGASWTVAVAGELKDARNKGCDVPLEEFPVEDGPSETSQFVRFRATSFYGTGGAGLSYMTWKFA
jgi:hypothetical protein